MKELTMDFGKPFQDANFLLQLIWKVNLYTEDILDALDAKPFIHKTGWAHGT